MQLNLNHIGYTYPGASEPVLTDVSATFPEGWTGLVGNNGCGKTTLALIAARLLAPDSGTVQPALFSAYCAQDSSIPPEDLMEFAADWERDAVRVRELLAIDDEWLWRFGELSGGQQKRIQLACALWRNPDVLVMDEPTNDLDASTRTIIEGALASFKGVGILISHDRKLLDSLVQQCLMFEGGRTVMRPGGYSASAAQAATERKAQLREREDAKREAARLQREATRRNEEAARSKQRLSARNVSKHDSDARERLGRARVSSKDSVAGRASATMSRRLASAQQRAEAARVEKQYDPSIGNNGVPSRARTVLHAEEEVLHTGDFTLQIPELWVGPTDHIGISGDNGTGKSTLAKHLLTNVPPSVQMAYLPQSVSDQQRQHALDALRELDAASAGTVLSMVARLNSDPDKLMDGSDTSPGEMRKLMLAEQLLAGPNLLILDEPTNHLDIGSIEALQTMLADFSAALILVSHDTTLLEATCPIRWRIEPDAQAGGYRLNTK